MRAVSAGTRAVLVAFMVLTALATNQLFVLAEHTDAWFSWTIQPPLTAAFLGASYAAGFVLVVLSFRARAWTDARVPVVTVLVFAVLTLLATLLHLDRFHFSAPGLVARFAAWFWLAIYLVVPVALAVVVARQQRGPGEDPVRRARAPAGLVVVVAVQGVVLLATGVVLFLAPGTAATLWPWPLTPLTARMVAAWLVAFGVAAALAVAERDLERLSVAAVGYVVVGVLQLVALARFGDAVRTGPAAAAYVVFVVSVLTAGVVGTVLAARARRGTPRAVGVGPA